MRRLLLDRASRRVVLCAYLRRHLDDTTPWIVRCMMRRATAMHARLVAAGATQADFAEWLRDELTRTR